MDNKEIWNKTAKFYDKIIKKDDKAYDKICNDIIPLIQNKDVLEIGCGTGKITERIYNKTKSIIATDFSKEMIKIAKKKDSDSKIRYEIADATNLSYEDKSFDVVVIVNCLHVVDKPNLVLNEITRVLKEDGILIAPTFCNKGLFKSFLYEILRFFTRYKFTKWNKEEYFKFLEDNNFKVIESQTINSIFPIECAICKKNDI